jgi:peroxiredoxin
MVELGELERHHAELAKRNVRVLAISLEDRTEAEKTQGDFPHLEIVADKGHDLISTVNIVAKGASPWGQDIAAPTTVLIDKQGIVRWLFRPDRYITRLAPDHLEQAIDKHL